MNFYQLKKACAFLFFTVVPATLSLPASATDPIAPPFVIDSLHRVDFDTSTQKHQLVGPTFGAFRLTGDGRIGYEVNSRRFVVINPEKYQANHSVPFLLAPPNSDFLSQTNFRIGRILLHPGESDRVSALQSLRDQKNWAAYDNLSEQTFQQGMPYGTGGMTTCNRVQEARACPAASDARKDCYDLTMVGLVRFNKHYHGKRRNAFKIRSQNIRVVVKNPKTSRAAIERIDMVGGIVQAGRFVIEETEFSDPIRYDSHGHSQFLEPAMTDDGRLLVFRSGFRKFLHGSSSPNNIDVNYMVAPETSAVCSAAGFFNLQTIAYAPHDPAMKRSNGSARYGIAAQPWRDGVGKPISAHATIGTYPWIDRKGDNVFFETVGSTLYGRHIEGFSHRGQAIANVATGSRYPTQCVVNSFDFGGGDVQNCSTSFPQTVTASNAIENDDQTRGVAVVGSWTGGRVMLLDGQINNVDYGVPSHVLYQRKIRLYRANTDAKRWVRIGGGRSIEHPVRNDLGYPGVNLNLIDSLANNLMAYKGFQTALPRDVVWIMNDNQGSAEISFDEYISQKTYINAQMVGAIEHFDNSSLPAMERTHSWIYYDGYKPITSEKVLRANGQADIRLQNGASGWGYSPPPYGELNNGRLEPVAQGGIEGKGLWMNGVDTSVRFPVTKAIANQPMLISIFLAPYYEGVDNPSEKKKVFVFPDGTRVFVNQTHITFTSSQGNTAVALPPELTFKSKKWTHLAIQVNRNHQKLKIFINGMVVAANIQLPGNASVLKLNTTGNLDLGGQKAFKGWVDDFKVLMGTPRSEVVCNLAYGSLYALKDRAPASYVQLANKYPAVAHTQVRDSLSTSFLSKLETQKYICKTDYTSYRGTLSSKVHNPNHLEPAREDILFRYADSRDGTLHWNLKRVDFTQNNFCLSCHTSNSPIRGLQLEPLAPGTTCASKDPRRQPMQPPKKSIFGITTVEMYEALLNLAGLDYKDGRTNVDMYNLRRLAGGNECR